MKRRQAWLFCLSMIGCATPLAAGTAELPGDVKAFDVIASFDKIAAYSGQDAKLFAMDARGVPSGGLLDLTKDYNPSITLQFAAKASEADVKAQGTAAPGSGYALGDFIEVEINIKEPETVSGTRNGSQYMERHLGMERKLGSSKAKLDDPYKKIAEPPKCALAQLWKDAIAQGAPADVVADIHYDANGYELKANGYSKTISFDINCALKTPQ